MEPRAAPALGYRRSPDQDAARVARHDVIVVGAGPVGLCTAIDLAQRGIKVLLLDEDDSLATGSRAICFAKRTLEIFDRLGCGERMVDKGVSWSTGKVFFQGELLYTFNLLPEGGHRRPAFINLQQYHVEHYLIERASELAGLEMRWKERVTDLESREDGVEVRVSTPEGDYRVRCDYLVAADGSRSPLRRALGLEARGHTFRDRFLIADVRMKAPFPTERWFWFDPPFHRNQSALLHRQPDDVWRIDFQLGWEADPIVEREPERARARVRAMLGDDVPFELEWVSVYTFSCVRMERFRHGRILFAGDAAHGVSPFGARGANSGIQDAENLAWKLAAVLGGTAPEALLDSYDAERGAAADENIRHSTRSTDFITPKSRVSRLFRDATLRLASRHSFARQLVNSGRLSTATTLADSPLNTPDVEAFASPLAAGSVCADAPLTAAHGPSWLLECLGGAFTLLVGVGRDQSATLGARVARLRAELPGVRVLLVGAAGSGSYDASQERVTRVEDSEGLVEKRYDLQYDTCYLVRPDQHVCARWRSTQPAAIRAAYRRALGYPAAEGTV